MAVVEGAVAEPMVKATWLDGYGSDGERQPGLARAAELSGSQGRQHLGKLRLQGNSSRGSPRRGEARGSDGEASRALDLRQSVPRSAASGADKWRRRKVCVGKSKLRTWESLG
ncbi:hypothetical protein E2562_033031 [Oryza meyeriana var. granulata]|uniref:DUF834 domain-containing protein n=1 Tax=Oryza meyeriana var. granulata TaxID=110450 RepID=A0A6G1CVV1_9ORYZ|nr:hypothetical protein E2562_033031 [Oryza meyeriana var. granulata]